MIAENNYWINQYEKYRKRLRDEKHSLKDGRGCWIWLKHKNIAGYGAIRLENKTLLAHRVSYRVFIGNFDKSLGSPVYPRESMAL